MPHLSKSLKSGKLLWEEKSGGIHFRKKSCNFSQCCNRPPHTPEGVNNNDKPKFSEIRLFAIDFAWEVRRDTNILGPSRFGKNWAQVLITESRHCLPRCPPRRGADPKSSHYIPPCGVSTPPRVPPPHPRVLVRAREGVSVSELSRRGAGNPAGNRVPDSGT